MFIRKLAVCLFSILGFATLASAQMDRINFSAGAGFSAPTATASNDLDTGWNLNFRGGLNATRHLALDLDFTYNRWNLNSTGLDRFGEPGGHVGIWSLTFQPMYRVLPRRSPVNLYGTAGFGLYHRNLTLTQPAIGTGLICDFFFGCFPVSVPVDQVVASFDTYKGGFNFGGGLEFRLGEHRTRAFAEARYHRMFTTHGDDLTFIPVTFGLRW